MVNVHCLNNIASVGLDLFSDDYNMESSYEDAQAVLVRSAKMHDMELNDHLLAIARAGAGVNNIPLDKCAEAGIVVFNTPGANANAVKEQVLAAMLLASRDLIGGNQWVAENKDNADIAKATEKAKKAFAGQVLSVLAQSDSLLPMQPLHWVWMFTVMIRIFQSMLLGIFQARLRILSM